jgi:hypothetical protein
MLRRLSVHAAGLTEPQDPCVWETLKAPIFEEGAVTDFNSITPALREYALAGVLHFEHFDSRIRAVRHAQTLPDYRAGSIAGGAVRRDCHGLKRLLQEHAIEWSAFTEDLGPASFVRKWIDTEANS